MATVTLPRSDAVDDRPPARPSNTSVWTSAFDAEERHAMLHDDLFAGQSVSLVLVSVVTAGLLIMILTVLMSL